MSIEVIKIPKEPQWEDIVIDANKYFNNHTIFNVTLCGAGLGSSHLLGNFNANHLRIFRLGAPLAAGDALSMGNPIPAVAGEALFAANDTTRSITNATLAKAKETRIWRAGEYRISFQIRATQVGVWYGCQVHRNGIAVGTLREEQGTTWREYTEVISGWSMGDFLQLYARVSGGFTAEVRRLRLFTADGGMAENIL